MTPLRAPFTAWAALLGVLAATAVLAPTRADASGCLPEYLPNGSVYRCSNCHVDPRGAGDRNPFGTLIEEVFDGCEPFWGPAISSVDSDGDGLSNGVELGDPLGLWEWGTPDPGDPAAVTNPGRKSAHFKRGDADGNGVLEIADAVVNLSHQFLGGGEALCRDALDFDDSGALDVTDAIASLSHQFLGGDPPPPPGLESCGPDPTDQDGLECEEFPAAGCE